jgi:hypothetical protein
MPHSLDPKAAAFEAKVSSPKVRPETSNDDDPLILWMLSLTPLQRLQVAQGFVRSVGKLRRARRI